MSMIRCSNCGSFISSKAAACPRCGFANNGGNNQTYYPPQQPQQPYQNGYTQPQPPQYPPQQPPYNPGDESNVGLNILSFLFPIIGIILYFALQSNTPIKAKGCLNWALISIGVSVALYLISIMIVFLI